MKVKLLTPRSGAEGSFQIGAIIDVSAAEAARMIDKGQAVPVRTRPAPEKAVATATSKRGGGVA